jgi:hypothetical protein
MEKESQLYLTINYFLVRRYNTHTHTSIITNNKHADDVNGLIYVHGLSSNSLESIRNHCFLLPRETSYHNEKETTTTGLVDPSASDSKDASALMGKTAKLQIIGSSLHDLGWASRYLVSRV